MAERGVKKILTGVVVKNKMDKTAVVLVNRLKKHDTYKKYVPDAPFEYIFLDQEFDRLYRSEQRLGKIFNYFSIIAIIISCLGLIGLTAFIIQRRTKEIGIRKVLGARPSIRHSKNNGINTVYPFYKFISVLRFEFSDTH